MPVADALTDAELGRLEALERPVVLLALTGPGTPALSPVALLRASVAAARRLPGAAVVAVPLASHGDPAVDHALGEQVVAAYAGPDPVLALSDPGPDDDVDVELPRRHRRHRQHPDQPAPEAQGLVLLSPACPAAGSRPSPRR